VGPGDATPLPPTPYSRPGNWLCLDRRVVSVGTSVGSATILVVPNTRLSTRRGANLCGSISGNIN